MLPPTVATHFFRWIPVASYDNSQSDIDVMFEYKYVSIPTGISSWPTNSFATICEKCTYFVPILSLPLFYVCDTSLRVSCQRYTVGTSWSEEMSSGSDISVTVEETMQVFHDHWFKSRLHIYPTYVPHTGTATITTTATQRCAQAGFWSIFSSELGVSARYKFNLV